MFLSNLNVEPDELHVIHLGTSMWFLGSVLWILVFQILPGSTSARADELWRRISRAYSALQPSTQYTNVSVKSFCDESKPSGHYPKLKGKGAEVKGLVEPLGLVWAELMDSTHEDHKLIEIGLQQTLQIQQTIDASAHDFFLPPADVVLLQTSVHEFLRVYTELGHSADRGNLLLFNMTHKFHVLWHLGQRASFLCPRRGACLIDEDYVGRIKEVAQACSAGTQLHQIPGKVLQKVRWGQEYTK